MSPRKLLVLLFALSVTAGCRLGGPHGTSGRSTSLGGGADLYSHYVLQGSNERVAVCHVLFVPQFDPRADHAFVHQNGGSESEYSFSMGHWENGAKLVASKPATVFGRKVFEAGGRRFDLDDGNIFVLRFHRDGSLDVSQVPRLEGEREFTEILAAVKKALPNDARVQALRLSV